ncbi:hypothetical protein SUDANB146_06355 [Streptomyces sp. enrichment culture]
MTRPPSGRRYTNPADVTSDCSWPRGPEPTKETSRPCCARLMTSCGTRLSTPGRDHSRMRPGQRWTKPRVRPRRSRPGGWRNRRAGRRAYPHPADWTSHAGAGLPAQHPGPPRGAGRRAEPRGGAGEPPRVHGRQRRRGPVAHPPPLSTGWGSTEPDRRRQRACPGNGRGEDLRPRPRPRVSRHAPRLLRRPAHRLLVAAGRHLHGEDRQAAEVGDRPSFDRCRAAQLRLRPTRRRPQPVQRGPRRRADRRGPGPESKGSGSRPSWPTAPNSTP